MTTACLEGSSSFSPSFLEDFTLHLASHLIGPDVLMSALDRVLTKQKTTKKRKSSGSGNDQQDDENDDDSRSLSFSLYWRSNMLLHNASSVLQVLSPPVPPSCKNTNEKNASNPPVLFVDITFSFVDNVATTASTKLQTTAQQLEQSPPLLSCQPSVSLVLGVFHLGQPKCTYLQGSPLTLVQLEEHSKKIGLDLHSAPAAMAGMMAKSLMEHTTNPPSILVLNPQKGDKRNDDIEQHDPTIEIPLHQQQMPQQALLQLYYVDVDRTGTIELDIVQQSSELDHLGMSVFCRDLFGSCRESHVQDRNLHDSTSTVATVATTASTTSDLGCLKEKFGKWWKRVLLKSSTATAVKDDGGGHSHPSVDGAVTMDETSESHQSVDAARRESGKSSSTRNLSSSRPIAVQQNHHGYTQLSHLQKRRKKGKNKNPFSILQK